MLTDINTIDHKGKKMTVNKQTKLRPCQVYCDE